MIDKFSNLAYLAEKIYDEEEQFDITEFPDSNTPISSHTREGQRYNLVERSIEQTVRSIIRGFKTKTSILIYGDPGLGKSSIVKSTATQIAAQLGDGNRKVVEWNNLEVEEKRQIIDENLLGNYFILWDIRTAMMEPSDITGMINIRGTKEYIQMKPQLYAYIMGMKDSAGLLFLDELNQGQKQVQNALFQLVLDRKIDALKMNDNWGIVAAGNLGGEFGNDPLPIALTSRFKAGVMVADSNTWLKWARDANVNEYICTFVESNPEENFYEKPTPDNQFACPRSFVTLSHDMDHIYHEFKAGGVKYDIMQEVELSAGEACGPTWAARFMAFLRFARHFDWDKVAATPKKFVSLKRGPDDLVNTVNTDQLQGLLLYLTKQVEKRIKDPKQYNLDKTVRELISILSELDEEWKSIFMNKFNKMDKMACANVIAHIYANKTKEPFASFISNHWRNVLDMNKKDTL